VDPVAIFVIGLMVGSVGILLSQAYGRRRISRAFTQQKLR
jgi:hypothetical protein